MEILLLKNTFSHCFEALSSACYGVIRFHEYPGGIILFHLHVEKTSGHAVLSQKLIEYALEYANEYHLKITPLCPHIKNYILWHKTKYKCVGKVYITDW